MLGVSLPVVFKSIVINNNEFVENNFMACRRRIVVFCQLTNLCKQEGTSDAPSEEESMNVNIRTVSGLSLVKFCHEIYGSLCIFGHAERISAAPAV